MASSLDFRLGEEEERLQGGREGVREEEVAGSGARQSFKDPGWLSRHKSPATPSPPFSMSACGNTGM